MLPTELSSLEKERYSRHLMLPQVGIEGQRKLKGAKVLCLGAGGLGSPALLYLAAAGIGTLGLMDDDEVALSNLQRQVLFKTSQIREGKVAAASQSLQELNPEIELIPIAERLTALNALEIVKDYDIVIDGSDNFTTRYLTNDACFFLKKPLVYGAIFQFEGQLSVFAPHLGGPCFRCLLPTPPDAGSVPSCNEAGVIGVLPGMIGTMQATEAVKLALGIGESALGRLIHYDALRMKFRELQLKPSPQCRLCGEHPEITSLITETEPTCPMDSSIESITATELRELIQQEQGLDGELIDVREEPEYLAGHISESKLMPLSRFGEEFTQLDASKKYYIHCAAGIRSMKAIEFLQTQGFTQLVNISDGYKGW